MIPITTAQFRALAHKAEQDLNWSLAVSYWEQALKVYPNIPGELAQADKDKIITAINADREMIPSSVGRGDRDAIRHPPGVGPEELKKEV